MKTDEKLSSYARLSSIICVIGLVLVLFFPMWKIELSAPQYPEGLVLKIWPHKLAGDVEIINGLNHYIGMRHMHTEDFPEFKILPYIIISLAIIGLIVFFLNRKKYFNAWFYIFIFISIISMADFYKWEYDYGHELAPEAPIQVPGMAYQPPLIGYKKLLNFGAYSIPDTGGWIFVSIGVILGMNWFINLYKRRK